MDNLIISALTKYLSDTERTKEVKNESLLVEDLGLDSLDMVELSFILEDETKISISSDEIVSEKMNTVQDLINFVLKKS